MSFLLTFTVAVLYFLPSIIAANKKRKNTGAIIALNLLTGWTFIMWVVCLTWALTSDK